MPVGFAHAGFALFSRRILLAAMGVALLSSVVPYTLEMFALAKLSSRVSGTLMSLEPAVAALFGLLLLRETFGTVLTSRGDQPDLSDPPANADAGVGFAILEGGGGDGRV